MNDLLKKEIYWPYEDVEILFKMGILSAYSEGNWMNFKSKPNLSCTSLVSCSILSQDDGIMNEDVDKDGSNLPDQTLRGPIWDYGLFRPNKECCYADLLFGKSRKNLLAEDEKILKGELWIPSNPAQFSFAYSFFGKLKKADPEATALLEIETGRKLTFNQVIQQTKSLASGLRWIGISPGHVIAIASYNSLEAQLMILASLLVGSWVALVDASLNPTDIGTLLRVVKPRLIFSECGKTLVKVETALNYLLAHRMPQLVVNNYKNVQIDVKSTHFKFKELLKEVEPHFKPAYKFSNPNNPLFILFTSGTTATPKGAIISEKYFTNSKRFLEHVTRSLSPCYTTLQNSPLIWVNMISNLLHHLSGGHRTVFFRGPTSEAVLIKALRKYEVSLWMTEPVSITSLLAWPAKPRCDTLRIILVGGMPFSAENTIRVRDELFGGNVSVCQLYGMTETGVLTFNTPLSNKAGSVGKVSFNTKMKVVGIDTGLSLGPCEEGELCFKTDYMMLGYYNNIAATEEVFDDDNFFHTGDQGFYDEQGFVYITGRIKDLIKWKSYQITPAEVEVTLNKQPAVKDCLVFGVYNETENQLVTAAVVLNPGYENTDVNMLKKIVNETLSDSKKIRGGIHIFEQLPHILTGKYNKDLIVKEVIDRIENPVAEESTY